MSFNNIILWTWQKNKNIKTYLSALIMIMRSRLVLLFVIQERLSWCFKNVVKWKGDAFQKDKTDLKLMYRVCKPEVRRCRPKNTL